MRKIYLSVLNNVADGKITYKQILKFFIQQEGYAYKELFKRRLVLTVLWREPKSKFGLFLAYHFIWLRYKYPRKFNSDHYENFISALISTGKDTPESVVSKRWQYLDTFSTY